MRFAQKAESQSQSLCMPQVEYIVLLEGFSSPLFFLSPGGGFVCDIACILVVSLEIPP